MRKQILQSFVVLGFVVVAHGSLQAEPIFNDGGYCAPQSCENCDAPTFCERIFGRRLPPQSMHGARRTEGLPKGRTYFGNRYFGNFNNRFFGPQYGYF